MSRERVFCLDTTTPRLMLALSREDEIIASYTAQADSHRYHSALLIPAVEDLFRKAGFMIKDLTALAINHGPGSFTGIRTGVAMIRTMGQFLDLPVHVFNTFELLACHASGPTAIYLDALRGRAYHAQVRFEETGPVYGRAPTLCMLPDAPLPDAALLVSEGLLPLFEGENPQTILPEEFSPDRMLALIRRYGDYFVRSWREVTPLYLQEPSVTLRKPGG